MSTCELISPLELADKLKRNEKVRLIDVRTRAEYTAEHVAGAECVPLQGIKAETVASVRGDAGVVYLICKSGQRARMAAEIFAEEGVEGVAVVDGGTEACVWAGLPMARGKSAVSLERQVRIAAGSLVLLGVALGVVVHPLFIGVSAFVGAGLVFAGVTNTCALGMLLARMPWNR